VPPRELAGIAKRAENEFVGAPTGIIDQSAAMLCRAGHAMLLDCGTLDVTHVPFGPGAHGVAALIADTRVPHALVDGEYGRRRAECEAAARLLGTPWLGLVRDIAVADRIADPVLRRRARHVISDSARARAIAAALQEADAGPDAYRFTGQLLTQAHVSLRDDFEVSWPEADVAVDAANAAGAYGARMIGGGFGGSVLALVPADRLRTVRGALTEAFVQRSWMPPEFLDAVPSAAARRIA
jgi:galactokinase